ncbi:major_cap_HK97, phage major capsid protein, HK97 family [uncultured Caudovirales phage]|uniref:Major_cap_HK97, phage major capsid protein, HK97 family n=1 Tax=uncultured Caudovirales phage TaxID=2100421 RepID=A0A6J5M264_9CAUD|nr:major_cap_HK97, phage major capsid protein, HK97 family [uncultured Caudovirales phage]
MSATQKIIEAIKTSLHESRMVKIDLREASTLTGSGAGIGGRTYFDDAFAALRYANPFRMGAMQIKTPNMSSVQFVAKTGNATNQTNPWGYTFTPNNGTPGTATNTWQLPTRVITAQLPIRLAALDDINGLQEELIQDLTLEFAQQEAFSMALNNDQAGSSTTSTGATQGLRGLAMYLSNNDSAFGTSGNAITDGIHTIASINSGTAIPTYNQIVDMAKTLPAQYWNHPSTAWHIRPETILALRELKDLQGLPLFLEIGERGEGAVGSIFGAPVIINPYLNNIYPIYLANWSRFLQIADVEEMSIQMFEQTVPGFVTMWAEKRMVSTVRDPFAGVRYYYD